MSRPAREIGESRQRPVDAGRGDFQLVIALDRVLAFEEFRQRVAERRAIFHVHAAVFAFGHHLQRLVFAAHQPEAHQPVARGLHDRGNDRLQMRQRRENGGHSNT